MFIVQLYFLNAQVSLRVLVVIPLCRLTAVTPAVICGQGSERSVIVVIRRVLEMRKLVEIGSWLEHYMIQRQR
jgi:hypothetical protein